MIQRFMMLPHVSAILIALLSIPVDLSAYPPNNTDFFGAKLKPGKKTA
jgi:hypothetical protein